MLLKKKKEILIKKIFENEHNNYVSMYAIISSNLLDTIIDKIDESSLQSNSTKKIDEYYINANQFLNLLDRFLEIFEELGTLNRRRQFYLEKIFISNKSIMEDYFTLSCSFYDNTELICEKIYRIILSNFIYNSKYIPSISIFLKENDLELKKIDEYTYNELKKLYNLFSDLIFCLRNRGRIHNLFINIDHELIHVQDSTTNKTLNENKRSKYISFINKIYLDIFGVYNNKKKYLKFFKN